jgi:hypothetical protein
MWQSFSKWLSHCFTKGQIERYEKEVAEKYDHKLVQESKRRIGNMSITQWQAIKTDGDEITRLIASVADYTLSQ